MNMKMIYEINQNKFELIPNCSIAYWITDQFISAFKTGKQLGALIPVKKGMDTGDNNKFLKLWFEVKLIDIDFFNHQKKYIPYDKGGEFRRWFGNNEYILDWEDDGSQLKNSTANLRSQQYYFKKSITWSALTSSKTSFRLSIYKGSFDSSGSSMFPDCHINFYLGFCNSKVADYYLSVINPTLNYGAGSIALLPILIPSSDNAEINKLVDENVSITKIDWDSFETSWDFKKHPLI